MSSAIAASLGLTRPRKRTTPILESGEFVAPPPTSFASPLVIGSVGTNWSTNASGKRRDADEESLFELEEYFVDGIRAVGTPRSVQQGDEEANGDESEEEWPTIRYVGGRTAPNTPKQANSTQMTPERSVTPKASRLMRVQTVKARAGGRKERDIGASPLATPSSLTPDLGALLSEAMGRTASTATIDRPFIGRTISYHPPTGATPDSLVSAASGATSTPLPAPVPPAASPLGVFIPLTMPLNVPHRPTSDPPPPPLPPKSSIRTVQSPPPAAVSPLASPASNPSPLSTPGRDQLRTLPPGFVVIPEAAYSQLMTPSHSRTSHPSMPVSSPSVPTPLSTPGRDLPPEVPTLPSTSAEAAQLHATMVAAAVAAATAQIERAQSVASNQTSSTSSSITIVPQSLQAGGAGAGTFAGEIARKPVPALFALSNAATQHYQAPLENLATSPMAQMPTPIRQLTLPEMIVTNSDQAPPASIVPGYSSQPVVSDYNQPVPGTDPRGPHRGVLGAAPASIPLSRYGTRGASTAPQAVIFSPPQRTNSISSQPRPRSVASQGPSMTLTSLGPSISHESLGSSNELSSTSLSLNRSESSLALLAPLTKFPDPAFPRRPLVLSEHLSRFRKSSATPTSPSSLWHETGDGQVEGPSGESGTKRRRKALGTVFRSGKGAAIKWVGKDGLLGEDESWTVQKWGLVFTVTTLFGYGLAGMICAFSTYLHSWQGADVAVVAETGLMTALTIAAFVLLLTSLLGLSGTLLNSRPLLAIYAVLLWPCLAVMLVVGYVSYRRAGLNLEGKIDQLWSQSLSAAGRKVVQDEFRCCGYYNSYHDATFTPTCFPRSNLPGCKGSLLRFETRLLQSIYRVVLGLVPLHLVNITLALLCANHVDRQFGKGLMPRQYRLKATDFSPLLLPTLSRTFPSLPSQHSPSLQRHATHRSTSSLSSFASTKEEDLVFKGDQRAPAVEDRQAWESSGGIRVVAG